MRPRHKFKAKRTNGFPSKLESAVYDLLVLRERAGEIADIKRQQLVVLQDGPRDVRITWRVDFSFVEVATGRRILAEAKGVETSDFKLKLKLYRKNPPFILEIYRGDYRRPRLAERILTKGD